MTKLSVNLNKVALIRNARGGNIPDLIQVAKDCESFGAEGITVHPRPDQRHVRYDDLWPLKATVTTEFNIEGNPTRAFLDQVLAVRPHQCTLVPDADDALTSDAGWDTRHHLSFLQEVIGELQSAGIRTSIFLDADPDMVASAQLTGTNRIELYTGQYARDYAADRQAAVKPFVETAEAAHQTGLGVNAGHDLNLDNLRYFSQQIPHLLEVSIGHAMISDALYYGLENVIGMYRRLLMAP